MPESLPGAGHFEGQTCIKPIWWDPFFPFDGPEGLMAK